MVLRGTINNISQPHVHAGSDITTGEVDDDRLPRIDELREGSGLSDNLDANTTRHGLLPKLPVPAVGGDPKLLYAGDPDPYWDVPPSLADLSDVMIVPPYPYDGQTLVYNGSYWYPVYYPDAMSRQAIINGNFDIWQRGTTFDSTTTPANSDDTYLPDRWILLSDGNDIVDVSMESTVIPSLGSVYSLKAEVETANKKFGFLTILESADAKKLAGKTVSLSFQARTTASKVIENLRAAVISWNSTEDTVTSDVVSAWENEGTNPTLVANWTYENTPANIAITTDFDTYKVEGIDIDTASTANIGVFIWVDDTDAAVDDLLYLSQVQLCAGDVALPFEPRSIAQEWADCLRYYYKISTTGRTYTVFGFGKCTSTTGAIVYIPLPVRMRTVPTLATNGNIALQQVATALTNTTSIAINTNNSYENALVLNCAVGSAVLVAGNATYLAANNDTTAYMTFLAEL